MTLTAFAAVALAVLVGSAVQGAVGLGVGLVATPVAALVLPELVPGVLLWVALVMALLSLVAEGRSADWSGLRWALPARVAGTVVGVWLVTVIGARELGVAVGVMVLLAVALTVWAVEVPVTRATLATAGLVSGVTGTTTSIGGPPMALLYQHREPRQVRATLAVYFVIGAALSLVGLTAVEELSGSDARVAAALTPIIVLGWLVSRPLRRRASATVLRRAMLTVCAASAVVLLVRSLLG